MWGVYLQLIWAYLKIGLFGFGGGYAMLSLIQREVVNPGWITNRVFTDIVAISQMTPGPIGINSATYVGYVVTDSVWGSIVTTITVVVPSFILVILANRYVRNHHEASFVKGALAGLRPIIVGFIGSAVLLLCNKDNFIDMDWSLVICASAFVLVHFVKLHPILIILLAGIAGIVIY